MSVKIRLQRHGRKRHAYYYIVVADSRSPRDGKFIERIGSYNPNTNPATIELDGDKALNWLDNGAQPTNTARAILSYKGVMYAKHLQRGVKKGAFSQEEADKKYAAWLEAKAQKIDDKIKNLKDQLDTEERTRLENESKVAHKRAEEIAKRNAPEIEVVGEEAPEAAEPTAEAEVTAEATETAEAPAETTEAPEAKAEETPEASAEESPEAEDNKEKE